MSIIRFSNVSYVYENGVRALNGVSFSVERGELVVLMGENGSGKTTILKHLNGLLKPSEGDVIVDGINTKNATVAELASKVGLVFQNADEMFFESRIEDEVAFALRNFGYDEGVVSKRVRRALEFLELDGRMGSSPFMLSGGEKKRLALAIILAWEPMVIALDEPTIGQDSIQKEKLAEMIKLLRTQDKTIVMASHDVEFIADLNPRIILLSKGRIVADGKAEEILTDIELLRRCSLLPPQLTLLMNKLADYGVSTRVLSVERALEEIMGKVLR